MGFLTGLYRGKGAMEKPRFCITKRRGSWWVRVFFIDPVTGKPRELTRAGRTRAEVCDKRDRLIRELVKSHGRSVAHERARFSDLANYYARMRSAANEY